MSPDCEELWSTVLLPGVRCYGQPSATHGLYCGWPLRNLTGSLLGVGCGVNPPRRRASYFTLIRMGTAATVQTAQPAP
jgi:hypothetical protein